MSADHGTSAGPTGPDTIPPFEFAARAAWVALRLLLVICLGEQGVLFFYQGF